MDNGTKILIKLEMPSGEKAEKKEQKSIEEKVRETIELVDSQYCSETEFIMLKGFLRDLYKMKKTPRVKNLIEMIEPVLQKYGYFGA